MTPPIFHLDDEVEIIGVRCDGQAELAGKRFKISQYHVDQDGERCSAISFPWYPASSLRLVQPFTKGEKVKVSLKGHLYNGYEFEVECVRDGHVEDSRGRRFRFGIIRKVEEGLKIGDFVEIVGPDVNGN